jgi:signal peptidase II
MKKSQLALVVIVLVLILDQALKIYVKTSFPIGGGFELLGLSWAKISFVENEGMAFGMTFGGMWGKVVLSLFRIVAIFGICYMLYRWIRNNVPVLPVIGLSLILAGAIGNAIDGILYGVMFSHSDYALVAQIFPEKGYAPFLWGKVVDMFYFPMLHTTWPDWVPVMGGEELNFFSYIFNVADSSIFLGCMTLIFTFKSVEELKTA